MWNLYRKIHHQTVAKLFNFEIVHSAIVFFLALCHPYYEFVSQPLRNGQKSLSLYHHIPNKNLYPIYYYSQIHLL